MTNLVEARTTDSTATLHHLGQSLWLDNASRELVNGGTLKRYIDELSVTGLTSNPTIFDKAIGGGDALLQTPFVPI